MASWSIVSTIKATEEKVLAFAAHHLSLGADHLFLFFDDPEQPVPAALATQGVASSVTREAIWVVGCLAVHDPGRHEHIGIRAAGEHVALTGRSADKAVFARTT